MRAGVSALLMVSCVSLASITAAQAKDPSPESVRGLYLATDFPALQIRAGEETTLPLTIYNYGLPPQRTSITIAEDLITGPDILSLLAASGAGTASSNARQIRWHTDKMPYNAIQCHTMP